MALFMWRHTRRTFLRFIGHGPRSRYTDTHRRTFKRHVTARPARRHAPGPRCGGARTRQPAHAARGPSASADGTGIKSRSGFGIAIAHRARGDIGSDSIRIARPAKSQMPSMSPRFFSSYGLRLASRPLTIHSTWHLPALPGSPGTPQLYPTVHDARRTVELHSTRQHLSTAASISHAAIPTVAEPFGPGAHAPAHRHSSTHHCHPIVKTPPPSHPLSQPVWRAAARGGLERQLRSTPQIMPKRSSASSS